MGDSSLRETSFVIKGPQYYVWSVRHPIGEISHEPIPVGVFLSVANAQPRQNIWKIPFFNSGQKFVRSHPSIRNCGASVQKCLNYRLTCFQSPGSTRYWPLPRTGILLFLRSVNRRDGHAANGRPSRNIIKSAIPLFWQQEIQTRSREADLYLHRPPVRIWRNGQPVYSLYCAIPVPAVLFTISYYWMKRDCCR